MFLEIRKVTKGFVNHGNKAVVLKELEFEVDKGEFISLLGPSGCGKSTLLSIIAGLKQTSAGSAYLEGRKITKPGKERGVVFQEPALFPWLTVEDNVMFPLYREKNKDEARAIAQKLLKLVRLGKYAKHHPHELSGGMQQRVSIARALAMNPSVLLMDEPFGALDEQTRMRLQQVLENIWLETEKTILFVTHSIQEAIKLSDRIIVMGTQPGRVLKSIPVDIERSERDGSKQFAAYENLIKDLLKTEIDKAEKEEENDAIVH